MTRTHCARKRIVALPPRGLRPRLDAGQRRDLELVHIVNLDTISRGEATESVLWEVVGGVLTWSRVAELLERGVDQMQQQLELVTRLVDRFGRTGRVAFTGQDYQLAKDGVVVMDLLADVVDQPTAIAAAAWSEARVERMNAACAARMAA